MLSRPIDASGDILPVLSPSDLLSGSEAASVSLKDHLSLLCGEWWEYAAKGNRILDLISDSRLTAQDAPSLSSYLVSYILSFPDIAAVSDAVAEVSNHTLTFSCTARLRDGSSAALSLVLPAG